MTFREIIGREEQNTDSIWLYREGMLYDVPDRDAQINKALDFCSEIKFVLQVLKDLKEISVNTFALASERVVSASKQLSALRGKVTAKVHEGD